MQTFELLDRLELLYPTNGNLADLRRSYIDHDLASIFRLTNTNDELRKAVMEQNLHSMFRVVDEYDTEELRKAVLEQNLHSIFRLVDDEDLRKLVLEDNTWKLWPILDRYVDTQFTAAFKNFFVNETEIWNDCFSRGQIESKLWLVKELTKLNLDLGTVFLCAGWYATLATMLFESNVKVDKIRSFDIDPSCVDIAEVFNKQWFTNQWHFKSITQDIMDINYNEHTWQQWSNANNRMSYPITDVPDTIINTSCEHIPNFTEWYAKIPAGKLVILQSNNFFEVDEHVNCSIDIEDFSRQTPLKSVLYSNSLELEKYTRYMRIGYK
tara:strand:- start:965 stop:1936 length:972 start_codon:yes stop_codon:yes gene_type:complete